MKPFDFIKKEIYDIGFVDPSEPIYPESTLQGDLSLDSLDFVELIMRCEKMYDICLEDDECLNIRSVQDLVDAINRLNPLTNINPVA